MSFSKNTAVYTYTVTNSNVQSMVVNVKRNCYVIHDVCRLPEFLPDRTERINLLDPNGITFVNKTIVELMTLEYGIEEFFDNFARVRLELLWYALSGPPELYESIFYRGDFEKLVHNVNMTTFIDISTPSMNSVDFIFRAN